jgi:hypothetical protein
MENITFGIILEETASTLTQGVPGPRIESIHEYGDQS